MSSSRPVPVLEPPAGPLVARLQTARALAARHRRLAAAVCAGAAVLAAVSALTPAAPAPSAAEPASGGLAPVALPAGAGAGTSGGADRVAVTVRLADAAGTLLLRPGIHVDVIGGSPAGATAATGGAGDAAVLAADAVVLAVPRPAAAAGEDGSLLAAGSPASSDVGSALAGIAVLSVSRADARRLAAAAGTRPLSVTVPLAGP